MLVFRGSPKSSKKSIRFLDEMQQQDEAEALHNKNIKQFQYRHLPKVLISGGFSLKLVIYSCLQIETNSNSPQKLMYVELFSLPFLFWPHLKFGV